MGGGDMIKEVHKDDVIYNDPPFKFEAGTPPIAEAIALAEAAQIHQKPSLFPPENGGGAIGSGHQWSQRYPRRPDHRGGG